jgi:hypothetical protein
MGSGLFDPFDKGAVKRQYIFKLETNKKYKPLAGIFNDLHPWYKESSS